MAKQGKQLTPEEMEMVIHLKRHFDKEKENYEFVSTKNPAQRAAQGLGISIVTVKRIMAQYHRSGDRLVTVPGKHPGRPPDPALQGILPIVRSLVQSENLRGQRVSLDRLSQYLLSEHNIDIPKMTLWRAVRRWGFTYGEGRRRDSLKEQNHVILARRAYLRAKRFNRNPDGTLKRPEVYLDETFINKNHSSRFTWYSKEDGPWTNKPSGVGPRLIVVHAITRDGWVEGAQLVFESKKRTGDYHGQMNWENFSKWFREQLMPHIPKNSIVILDNAKYHNVLSDDFFPRPSNTKIQLREWLTHNGYPWSEDMLKFELFDLCSRLAPAPEYRLDQIASENNLSILRTPPYHPELQPIECCWAVVKNYLADHCDYTMVGLRERLPIAFSKVTSGTIQEIISKVNRKEDEYWVQDEVLDENYSVNAEEEYLSAKLHANEEEQHFAEA